MAESSNYQFKKAHLLVLLLPLVIGVVWFSASRPSGPLQDLDSAVRERIIRILAEHSSEQERLKAISQLAKMSPKRIGSIPKEIIEQLANHPDPNVRKHTAELLGTLIKQRAELNEQLKKLAQDEDPTVRAQATKSLSELAAWTQQQGIGKDQLAQTDQVIRNAKDSDPQVRKEAARALGWIKDKKALKDLIPLLGDSDESVRKAAIDALKKSSSSGRSFTDKLKELLTQVKKKNLKKNILRAAIEFGDPTKLTEILIQMLKDENLDIRVFAARELGDVRYKRGLAAAALDNLVLADEDYDEALVASAHSLYKLSIDTGRALLALTTAHTRDLELNSKIDKRVYANQKQLMKKGVAFIEFWSVKRGRSPVPLQVFPVRPKVKPKTSRLSISDFLGQIYEVVIQVKAQPKNVARIEVHQKYTPGDDDEDVEGAGVSTGWIDSRRLDDMRFRLVNVDRPVAKLESGRTQEIPLKDLIIRIQGYSSSGSKTFEKELKHKFLSLSNIDLDI